MRVAITLTASFQGACPNLMNDLNCAIYERRPAVCRIYPAEVNPFLTLAPSAKACPPEAWDASRPSFIRGGVLVDAETRSWIRKAHVASEADADCKSRVCELLGIRQMAMANEGFVVHSPNRSLLEGALKDRAGRRSPVSNGASEKSWGFVSNRRATVDALHNVGAEVGLQSNIANSLFEYIGFNLAD